MSQLKKRIESLANIVINSLKAKYLKRNYPIITELKITPRCNTKCFYCDINKFKTSEFTKKQVLYLVKDLKILGCCVLIITGGEPTIREDLGEILDYCNKIGIITLLCTNGLEIKEKLETIKKATIVAVSLDGPKEMHEKTRKKGTYDKTIKSLDMLKENKIDFFITSVINKYNINNLNWIARKSKELKCNVYFILPSDKGYGSVVSKDIVCNPKKLKWGIKKLLRDADLRYIGNSRKGLKMLMEKNIRYRKLCLAGRVFCTIGVDGKVIPCGWINNLKDYKKFQEEGLKKAFDHMNQVFSKSCNCSNFCNYSYINLNLFFRVDLKEIFNFRNIAKYNYFKKKKVN